MNASIFIPYSITPSLQQSRTMFYPPRYVAPVTPSLQQSRTIFYPPRQVAPVTPQIVFQRPIQQNVQGASKITLVTEPSNEHNEKLKKYRKYKDNLDLSGRISRYLGIDENQDEYQKKDQKKDQKKIIKVQPPQLQLDTSRIQYAPQYPLSLTSRTQYAPQYPLNPQYRVQQRPYRASQIYFQ